MELAAVPAILVTIVWIGLGLLALWAYRRLGARSGLWVALMILVGLPVSLLQPVLIGSTAGRLLAHQSTAPFGLAPESWLAISSICLTLLKSIAITVLYLLVLSDMLHWAGMAGVCTPKGRVSSMVAMVYARQRLWEVIAAVMIALDCLAPFGLYLCQT